MTDIFTTTAVEQGSVMLFSHHETGGIMWTGTGSRSVRKDIEFSVPFMAPPFVHVSMGLIDIETSVNMRTDLVVEDITAAGCAIVFRTWGDSRIARIRAEWMAIGPGHDPAIWAVD